MSVVLSKAKDLADAIAESSEIKTLRDAEIAMNLDQAALAIIDEFQNKQREYQEVMMSGGKLSAPQEAEHAALEEKMEANNFIRTYFDAQQEVEKLLQAVNMIVSRAISGEDASQCGSGCGSGCSSSGCC